MAEERKSLIERLKTRKTIILREPLLARLERKKHGSPVEAEGSLASGSQDMVKHYSSWIQRLKIGGMRDPSDPFKMIPPDDPRTKREIERLEIELAFAKGEIGLDEYHRRYEEWEKGELNRQKSTYQLYVEKASRELAEAKDHLRRYAETTECGWCKQKAESLAKTTEQLEALTPLAQEFSEKVGALEAEELQNLSEEITQIREWLEKAAGNPAKNFHVRYIDQTTGKTVEKTVPEIEQYDLYRLQREGKISIIEIHSVK